MTALDRLREQWTRDPAFRAAYAAEYPYDADSLRVTEYRASLGLDQGQFAGRMGRTIDTIQRWESAKHPVPAWVLERAAAHR